MINFTSISPSWTDSNEFAYQNRCGKVGLAVHNRNGKVGLTVMNRHECINRPQQLLRGPIV